MFSSTVEYAFRAIVTLASRNGQSATAKDIAAVTKSPPNYVSKVMQTLVEGGLVNARRGPNGGFTLARPPEHITLLDVVNAVDPIERIRACPIDLPEHAHQLCPLHRVLDDTLAYVESQLGRHTIAALMDQPPAAISPFQLTISARRVVADAAPARRLE